jgi:SnoaL-like domain
LNPIIKVEGNRAIGEWKLFQPCTLQSKDGPRAMWLAAIYHDEYVKTSSGWKYQSLKVDALFFTPYEEDGLRHGSSAARQRRRYYRIVPSWRSSGMISRSKRSVSS